MLLLSALCTCLTFGGVWLVFAWSRKHANHLSLVALVPIGVALAGTPAVWLRQRMAVAFLGVAAIGVLADYDSWARRLETEGITHVMSFPPRSVELRFMEQHPE
jgi:hypothetical protein